MSQTNEVGWVIEAAGPKYWTGRKCVSEAFSDDHGDAVRFARARDASAVLAWCFPADLGRLLAVREHVWMGGVE